MIVSLRMFYGLKIYLDYLDWKLKVLQELKDIGQGSLNPTITFNHSKAF